MTTDNELQASYDTFMEAVRVAEAAGVVLGICTTHDSAPMTDDQEEQWEQGFDPCAPAIVLTRPALELMGY